ncbi:succinate dehydrogenase cytochrome b subunit [Candidatus Sumerlaeota bacterium]
MKRLCGLFCSTVGQKIVMALTGLMLVGFVIGHLVGNLQLLLPGEYYFLGFNKYALHLEKLGPALWLIEVALIGILLCHVVYGALINWRALMARPSRYASEKTKGGESKNNFASRNMLLLGVFVLAFIVLHVWQFKFGPGGPGNPNSAYETTLHGEQMRDLHKLVVETFKNPAWVTFYVGFLVLLGFHLRHGVWSAFQSLGAMPGGISKLAYAAGGVLAVLLVVGFVFMPIWILWDPLSLYDDIERRRGSSVAGQLELQHEADDVNTTVKSALF